MIIQVDKEAAEVVQKLCDIALRAGGLANMETIAQLLKAMKVTEEARSKDKEKSV